MPSHSVRSPNLLVCCCWTSQNPHPSSSRSTSLSAGGWHQALARGASDSTNTFAFGLNPTTNSTTRQRRTMTTMSKALRLLNYFSWYECCFSSYVILPLFTILHLQAFVLLLVISTLHLLYSLLSTSSPIVYTNDVIQPVMHCVARTEAEQHDEDLRRSIL